MASARTVAAAFVVAAVAASAAQQSSNIVFFLTDNQDVVLGGFEPMANTKMLVADKGVTFANAFVSTPVCCPSRASILTGRYPHNTGVFGNTDHTNCNGDAWRQGPESDAAFAVRLADAGYETMYAGKYLNRYGLDEAGGIGHVPPGWTHWRALVGNSVYYNYTLSVDGAPEEHGDDYAEDYLTDVITRKALAFLAQERDPDRPFMMVLSSPAPHRLEIPAPQYAEAFAGLRAPRDPTFGRGPAGPTKHWFARMPPPNLTEAQGDLIDERFRRRWRTLLSVDDQVAAVVAELERQGVLDDTYLVFTSDHGFHLGQFSMPFDMRQPYETDIRVPLVARGPGIARGSVVDEPVVVTIDLAPTFLDMAGLPEDASMDGRSFLGSSPSRSSFLVEYSGEGGHKNIDAGCAHLDTGAFYGCYEDYGCKCLDASNNTYLCIRTLSPSDDTLFCEFADDEGFVEMYDLRLDPYQQHNLAADAVAVSGSRGSSLWRRMRMMTGCAGAASCTGTGTTRRLGAGDLFAVDLACAAYLVVAGCLLIAAAMLAACRYTFSRDYAAVVPGQ